VHHVGIFSMVHFLVVLLFYLYAHRSTLFFFVDFTFQHYAYRYSFFCVVYSFLFLALVCFLFLLLDVFPVGILGY